MSIKQLKPYLKNLADIFRSFTGTTDKINAQDFPQRITQVYDIGIAKGHNDGYSEGYNAGQSECEQSHETIKSESFEEGKQAEYDRFWDAYQANGSRGQYQYAFCLFDDETFKPKYDLVLKSGYTGTNMFYGCAVTNLVESLEKQGVVLDTSKSGYIMSMFYNAATTRIPTIDCTHAADYSVGNGMQYAFRNCKAETIDKVIVVEKQKYLDTFRDCTNLKNIVFEGVIGEDISFADSPLSKDSIISIINHLSETASGKTLSLKKTAVNTAFSINVDDESTYPEGSEYYTLRHSKDNWTFSYV